MRTSINYISSPKQHALVLCCRASLLAQVHLMTFPFLNQVYLIPQNLKRAPLPTCVKALYIHVVTRLRSAQSWYKQDHNKSLRRSSTFSTVQLFRIYEPFLATFPIIYADKGPATSNNNLTQKTMAPFPITKANDHMFVIYESGIWNSNFIQSAILEENCVNGFFKFSLLLPYLKRKAGLLEDPDRVFDFIVRPRGRGNFLSFKIEFWGNFYEHATLVPERHNPHDFLNHYWREKS